MAVLRRVSRACWAHSSTSTRARSSASPATASWSSSTIRCRVRTPTCRRSGWRSRCATRRRQLALQWRKHGHELGFGVGIAHGYATLGRIGFEGRFDYGAVGTVVNLAARLCADAKDGQILIDPKVQAAIEAAADTEPAGELLLKGFHRPVRAFNVCALQP